MIYGVLSGMHAETKQNLPRFDDAPGRVGVAVSDRTGGLFAPSAGVMSGGASMLQGASVIAIHVEWKIESLLEAGAPSGVFISAAEPIDPRSLQYVISKDISEERVRRLSTASFLQWYW